MENRILGFLLETGPYTFENSRTLYELAKAGISKGHKVKVFLFIDGVNNAKLNQDPDPERPMNQMFQELADAGVEFQACGLCTSARGFAQDGSDFVQGVTVSGLTEFGEIVGQCDRFVTFTM